MANANLTVTVDTSALLNASLHDICVISAIKMVEEEITKHVSFIDAEDTDKIIFKSGGKILKVTIEWVDESEANPEDHMKK